jgi:asparagine synthase (glutamine-hydrolysing)
MCGIAGIILSPNKNNKETHSLLLPRLQQMIYALRHRGPDGEHTWINENGTAGLGHRRLSVIDLSDAGKQPMHYRERYTVIHNGEIYNYVELRNELTQKGYTFRSQTDTEVIAAAYDHWQDECVDRFDGMFAFAIWDEKEKELFAARDRFGEKPFYFSQQEGTFLFASEMKALWSAGISREPNLKMLFNFITIGYTDNPEQPAETFFENINKLAAASTLRYSAASDQLVLEKYWDIDPDIQQKNITDRDALETFKDLFTTSIQRRLRSDVAIGTSLSGGLDSSSVVATACLLTQPHSSFTSFTATFPGFEKNEYVYAKMVSDQFKLQHITTVITVEELLRDWDKLCYHQEEPFGSAGAYAQFRVFELAKEKGVKVLLDGQGADETLAGYSKYYKWYWQELFRRRKLFRSKELKAAREAGIEERFGLKNMIASYFPEFATVTLERQYLLRALQHEDLTRDFVRSQSKEAYYTTPEHFTLNGVLYFNTCIHGLEELLRYADRNAMAHGREVRLPFLSHELVEFIFSLPPHYKIRNAWTKWLLRKSMEDVLPASITWRKDKVGFEPPQKTWMENRDLQELIIEAKRKLVKENILKPEVLNKSIHSATAYEANNYDWRYLSAALLFK